MKTFYSIACVVVFVLGVIGTSYAPDTPKFKVYVDVSSEEDDKTEANILESHLKKELRALGDVVIVDKTGDWQFRIMVSILGANYKDGRKAPEAIIASVKNVRIPKHEFRDYDSLAPTIPVHSYGPHAANWHRDNLPEWCVFKANDFDRVILTYCREMTDIMRQKLLYYP